VIVNGPILINFGLKQKSDDPTTPANKEKSTDGATV
jgi:SecD/SecF fusion protein